MCHCLFVYPGDPKRESEEQEEDQDQDQEEEELYLSIPLLESHLLADALGQLRLSRNSD